MPLKSCGGPIGREPVPGILPKQPAEGGKQVRMVSRKVVRTCEETLGCYRKKLGMVFGAVVVQQSRFPALREIEKPLKLQVGHPVPAFLKCVVGHGGRAVRLAVEPVHVMGKLVQNQVPPRSPAAALGQHNLPGEDDRPALPRFARSDTKTKQGFTMLAKQQVVGRRRPSPKIVGIDDYGTETIKVERSRSSAAWPAIVTRISSVTRSEPPPVQFFS